MTKSTKYFIWLTLGLGFASPKILRLLSLYSDIKELYDGGERELRFCGIFTENEITKLLKTDISKTDAILAKCRDLRYDVIDISEDSYPKKLRMIEDPPAVIYVNGKLPDIDNLNSVAVIGTRKATVYGVRTAFELGANLSKKDFVVVSGGALGIDCAAHRGVLDVDGVTICVLGCGIDYEYLRENKAMRDKIAENGAVISEYPPGTAPSAHNFPQRNRIISGLSDGTVVVEAPLKSGSMITVNLALAQSRDVFAVMGNIDSPYSAGSNALIKDGAVPVTSYRDILEYYRGVDDDTDEVLELNDKSIEAVPTKLKSRIDLTKTDNKPQPMHRKDISLSSEEERIYYLLGNTPMHIDTIIENSELPAFKVLRSLSSLEIKGLISNPEGRNYIIK